MEWGFFGRGPIQLGRLDRKSGRVFSVKTCPSKSNGLKQRFQSVAGIKNPWFLLRLCPTRAAKRLRLQLIFALGNVTKAESYPLQNGTKKMHHRSTAVHPTILSERYITLWCIRCHLRLPYTQELLTHEQVFECICQVGRFFWQTLARQLIPSLLFYHHLATTIIY